MWKDRPDLLHTRELFRVGTEPHAKGGRSWRRILLYVALDDSDSKRKIVAGILRPEDTGPELREMPNDPHHIQRLFKRLRREGPAKACDEAGVSGYDLSRQIVALGVACDVIAPALTPRLPGNGSRSIGGTPRGSSCSSGPGNSRRSTSPRRPKRRGAASSAVATRSAGMSSAGGIASSSSSPGTGADTPGARTGVAAIGSRRGASAWTSRRCNAPSRPRCSPSSKPWRGGRSSTKRASSYQL